jgi:hypothetical protein
MDDSRSAILGEIAAEAGLERASFLNDAAAQFVRFLDANRSRIEEVGGLVLIDEDPDYLSVAPDGTFRSRSRYQDETTGEWVSDTEVIESGAELVELYNPAELYAAFADAAREQAGLPDQPTAADDLLETAGISTVESVDIGEGEPDEDEDDWTREGFSVPRDTEDAARMLYDLALTFQERSQRSEARILDQFQDSSAELARLIGDRLILDDEDERLWYRATGAFEAEVIPERSDEDADAEGAQPWRALTTAEEMVQFYDPTDLLGDLAEALAEQYPGVAPELGDAEPG